jgi:hypothetical protein
MRAPFLRYSFVASLSVATLSSAVVVAQERSVTVLSFSANGDFGELPSMYFNEMRRQVMYHPAYELNDVPEQSLDEMLGLIGCTSLSTDCAELLQEILGSELLASGEVFEDGDLTAVRIRLWDLSRGQEYASRTFSFANGRSILEERAELFTRSLLYGSDGEVRITSSPSGATVFVNGTERGTTPLLIEGLPLGLYNVRVEADGHMSRTEAVAVDLGRTEADFPLTSQVATRGRTRDEPRAPVGRYVSYGLIAAGVGLVGGGIGTGVAQSNTQDEFNQLLRQPLFDRSEAESLRDRGESQALTSNILIGVGSAVLVTGVILTVVHHLGESRTATGTVTPPPAGQSSWRLSPSVGREGGSLQLGVTF